MTRAPAIRVGYLVVPKPLVEPVARALRNIGASPAVVVQAALAQFIAEGHLRAHVRRMRARYEERRVLLIAALEQHVGGLAAIERAPAGLQLALGLPPAIADLEVERRAAAAGLEVLALSRLGVLRRDINGLLLGYGNVAPQAIVPAVRRLARIIEAIKA